MSPKKIKILFELQIDQTLNEKRTEFPFPFSSFVQYGYNEVWIKHWRS